MNISVKSTGKPLKQSSDLASVSEKHVLEKALKGISKLGRRFVPKALLRKTAARWFNELEVGEYGAKLLK